MKKNRHLKKIRSLQRRIEELETICAEAYQVVGSLADDAGRFQEDDVEKILDHLSQMKIIHPDVLPWKSQKG